MNTHENELVLFYEDAKNWYCSECKTFWDMSPTWRWRGDSWEHKCPNRDPNGGHYPGIKTSAKEQRELLMKTLDWLFDKEDANQFCPLREQAAYAKMAKKPDVAQCIYDFLEEPDSIEE